MKEMFQRQIGGSPDIKTAMNRADSLWAYATKIADGAIPTQELQEACSILVETQIKDIPSRCKDLWPVLVVDQMPSEAWADFVFMPSYAACAILLCGYRNGCAEQIPGLESTLRRGLRAAFPNGRVSSHGIEWAETTQKVIDLMHRCGLQDMQKLFGETLSDSRLN